MNRLENKVIVVTGGNGLLGSRIIKDIQKEGGIAINAEINVTNTEDLSLINCDITNESSTRIMVDKIIEKYGKIDGLVNNAYPRTADWSDKFENIKYSSWKSNVDMQMNSLFLLCQTTLNHMKSIKGGSIVNIASIYGVIGPDFSLYEDTEMTMPAAYSAIKGGVINFTRYLASYYGNSNIRVNCVSPGGVFNNQNSNFVKKYETKVPMKRMALPDDIAPCVSFLLSDSSSYITGQNIIIDGGLTIL
jgi:NAD(P)-dependent dehydrogenase (short-subunit alcohol dehydrogenase family)